MTCQIEIDRQKKRLDAVFVRASKAGTDAELLSDLAKYLCVLVAGFLEQAMIEIAIEYVRKHAHTSVQRHVEVRLRRFTSANCQNVIELLGSFNPDWKTDLEDYLVDEHKAAVDSVVNLRHTIAHGRFTGVTMAAVQSYYGQVKQLVEHCIELCIP